MAVTTPEVLCHAGCCVCGLSETNESLQRQDVWVRVV
jgi:hypothetical protein